MMGMAESKLQMTSDEGPCLPCPESHSHLCPFPLPWTVSHLATQSQLSVSFNPMDSFFSSLQTVQRAESQLPLFLASFPSIQIKNAGLPALVLYRITALCGFIAFSNYSKCSCDSTLSNKLEHTRFIQVDCLLSAL